MQLLAQEIVGPVICALSRAVPADIEACGKALAKPGAPRIHTGIGVSDIHVMGKFRDERYGQTMAEKKATMICHGRRGGETGAQLCGRRGILRRGRRPRRPRLSLSRCCEAAIEAGATVVNIPDTTGYTVPEQYGALIREDPQNVPNIARATISVHCHDDLGLAVANTLAAC